VAFDSKSVLMALWPVTPRCIYDPRIAGWMLSPDEEQSYELEPLCSVHHCPLPTLTGLQRLGSHARSLMRCAALQAILDTRLAEWDLLAAFREQEMELVPVLASMELAGICFDDGELT
jgi:DNA polymerase I-like protein with 3'-5' exonuclease and polymerase domains